MKLIEIMFPKLKGDSFSVFIVFLSVVIFFYAVNAIAEWKFFNKIGENGWKAFIPFYNLYLVLKRCSKQKFLLPIIIALVAYCVLGVINYSLDENGGWFLFYSVITCFVLIFLVYLKFDLCYGVSLSFGYGKKFAVGLTIIPIAFILVLGFGKAEYKGNQVE